jgi:CubicO group peptidase (beta-lactamase class C family)
MNGSQVLPAGCAAAIVLLVLVSRTPAQTVWPAPDWAHATPQEAGMDRSKLEQARDYALTGGGSGIISRGGKVVMTWGDLKQRYDLKSSTKSIGVTALGLAIADGKLSLEDRAADRHPDFTNPPQGVEHRDWFAKITLLQLATQTAGFAKPGGSAELLFEPGSMWHYSDSGPNWLAECVTLAYGRDVNDLMFERVFTPLGITADDLVWRKNAYRPETIDGIKRREFGSGISANVDAMARIGYLYLRGGEWNGKQIIPRDFVDACGTTVPSVVGLPEHEADTHGNASDHYGLLWWNNADGTLANVPRDAYWSWGLYDSLIVVIPSLDIVVARAGSSWQREDWSGHYDVLKPFLEPIAASVGGVAMQTAAPYPPSPVITGIEWASASAIIRKAEGSDNWPLTWGDDDCLYTAYGDGWGFEPRVPEKLSLGFARVTGGPDQFAGVNIRSATGEDTGDGRSGKKASGILMVDGTLYMWARNAGNSQLAWSTDRARTWTWSDWRFTESFGCPTFLNFGPDYAGARDEYVYVYSFDSDSAYEPADRMVLARVPKDRIRDREAYEFFARLTPEGEPTWAADIAQRGAVFSNPGRCYRSNVTYNAPLKRYLWCQTIPGDDTRFAGGFAIYDAPEPWGPWTTVFFTEQWDVGPGESSSLPTKWMSADGKTVHLVFSGDDCFSVRQATLAIAESPTGG